MLTSLVIPAHNEEAELPRTLRAAVEALRFLGTRTELVVVDDASNDRTATIAGEFGAAVVRIERRQIAASRNAGARATAGDRLVFLDADTRLPADTLAAAGRAMDRGFVGGGAQLRFDGAIPLYGRIVFGSTMRVFTRLRWFPGCFVFCTRAAFEAVGGFDETLFASEEVVFARALKRVGRTVTLPEHTITSARKLRQFSGLQILRRGLRIAVGGRRALQSRDALDLWYGPRPEGSGRDQAGAGDRPG